MRIAMMVLRLFLKAPYYFIRIWWCGKSKKVSFEEAYALIKKVTKAANRAGRVKVEAYGLENIPKKGRVLLAGNHTKWLDPVMLVGVQKRQIHFLAKE